MSKLSDGTLQLTTKRREDTPATSSVPSLLNKQIAKIVWRDLRCSNTHLIAPCPCPCKYCNYCLFNICQYGTLDLYTPKNATVVDFIINLAVFLHLRMCGLGRETGVFNINVHSNMYYVWFDYLTF